MIIHKRHIIMNILTYAVARSFAERQKRVRMPRALRLLIEALGSEDFGFRVVLGVVMDRVDRDHNPHALR